jgi:Asp/Glu/hydantoin racemase
MEATINGRIGISRSKAPDNDKFTRVGSSGLGILELYSKGAGEVNTALRQVARSPVLKNEANVICLGCAGTSGMREAILQELEGANVRIVDDVIAGLS